MAGGGSHAQISEAYLLPVLEAMLAQFPFHIRGFHSDNGSEFINIRWPIAQQVAHRADQIATPALQ